MNARALLAIALPLSTFGCAHATDPDPPKNYAAFVTRAGYTADLKTAGGAEDGLAGADTICNNAAAAAETPGRFVAWLSSTSVDAIDRVQGNGPWVKYDGDRVFNNRAGLTSVPLTVLDSDEYGHQTFDGYWTGTGVGGRVDVPQDGFGSTCGDWTTPDETTWAVTGQPLFPDESWTSGSTAPCTFPQHLLCLEQADPE